MKIRTDFVTNSSSASFILEIIFESTEGKKAEMYLAVSPEICSSEDGDIMAEEIHLAPEIKNKKAYFSGKTISSASDVEELCDILFGTAEIEGWRTPGTEEDEEDLDWEDGETVAVKDVAPKTIASFLKECLKNGITTENLARIEIRNERYGSGETAMWVDPSAFDDFRNRYADASQEEKEKILEELVRYLMSDPVLPVEDNFGYLPEEVKCVWNCSKATLRKEMRNHLEGNSRGYWPGTFTTVYVIDSDGNLAETMDVLVCDR